MLAAWTVFGAAALLSVAPSRHLFPEREVLGYQVWFLAHRTFQQVAWLLNVVAVAVMVGDRGFQPIKDLRDLDSQGYFLMAPNRFTQEFLFYSIHSEPACYASQIHVRFRDFECLFIWV